MVLRVRWWWLSPAQGKFPDLLFSRWVSGLIRMKLLIFPVGILITTGKIDVERAAQPVKHSVFGPFHRSVPLFS